MANSNDIKLAEEARGLFEIGQIGGKLVDRLQSLETTIIDPEEKGKVKTKIVDTIQKAIKTGNFLSTEKLQSVVLEDLSRKNISVDAKTLITLREEIVKTKQEITNFIGSSPILVEAIREERRKDIKNDLLKGIEENAPEDWKKPEFRQIAETFAKKTADHISDGEIVEPTRQNIMENLIKEGRTPEEIEKYFESVEGILARSKMSPQEVNEYRILMSQLEGKIPYENERVRAYTEVFKNSDEQSRLFDQAYGLTKRISQNFIGKVKNEQVGNFFESSIKILSKDGLQKGIPQILAGITRGNISGVFGFAGGIKNIVSILKGGTAAISGAATAGLSFLAIGAKKVLTKLGDFAKGILKDIGLSFGTGIGKFLDTLGPLGEFINQNVVKTVESAANLVFIVLIAVFCGIFLMGCQMQSLMTSVAPIQEEKPVTIGQGEIICGALNLSFRIPSVSNPPTRQDLINVSRSLLNLPYFWGGKYPKKGASPEWGLLKTVTSPPINGWSYEKQIPYGLDCSGFVDWVYVQLFGKTLSGGGGTDQIWANLNPISKSQLEIGDIGYMPGHVGIYIGNGQFIQAVGRGYSDNPRYCAGKVQIRSDINFRNFGRPKDVKFNR